VKKIFLFVACILTLIAHADEEGGRLNIKTLQGKNISLDSSISPTGINQERTLNNHTVNLNTEPIQSELPSAEVSQDFGARQSLGLPINSPTENPSFRQ
jgi:TRAP-type uncharacterized transport system substrate-binding protein